MIAAILLLSLPLHAVDPVDGYDWLARSLRHHPAPTLQQRPEPYVASDRPDSRHPRWVRCVSKIGAAGLAAKIADDSVDFAVGANKARYLGAAGFVAVYLIETHGHIARCGK